MLALFIDLYHGELQCTTELLVVPSCSSKDGWRLLQAPRFSVACLSFLRDCEYILFVRTVWEFWNRFWGFLDFLQHVIAGQLVWCTCLIQCGEQSWGMTVGKWENGGFYLRDSSIWVFVSRGNKNVGSILEFPIGLSCFSGCFLRGQGHTEKWMIVCCKSFQIDSGRFQSFKTDLTYHMKQAGKHGLNEPSLVIRFVFWLFQIIQNSGNVFIQILVMSCWHYKQCLLFLFLHDLM